MSDVQKKVVSHFGHYFILFVVEETKQSKFADGAFDENTTMPRNYLRYFIN